jgi:photosystem II stability/assembly factor-like uncharacterized protein
MRIAAVHASVVFSAIAASASLATIGAWTQSTNLKTASVLAIAIDPVRPSTLYAATYKSGVIKSTDGGRSWRGAGVGQGVRSLAIDPESSSTVYAGTWRRGIYKTTDGGARWSVLKLPYNDMGVLALAVDPRSPETVYAGTESLGIVKTTDGGVTWMETNRGIGRRMVLGLAIDPISPGTVYAATFREGYSSGSIFKTTNGGKSWRELKRENLATGEMVAVDPRRHSTLYAILDYRLYMSTNSGATWSIRLTPSGGYPSTVAVHPQTSHVYLGMRLDGRTLRTGLRPSSAVFRSVDQGRTWQPFGSGLEVPRRSKAGTTPPSVKDLAFARDGRALFAATAGGGVFGYSYAR